MNVRWTALLFLVAAGCSDEHGGGADAFDAVDAAEGDSPLSCPEGTTHCGDLCVVTSSDHDHCGACNVVCLPAEVCNASRCDLECPADRINCSGSCVSVDSDVSHCGRCGHACATGTHVVPSCEDGVCAAACEEGWNDLDGDGSCETQCTPSTDEEVCNGIDDNCDGSFDEGFDCTLGREVSCTTDCGTPGSGICALGCEIPPAEDCRPPDEICDGEDNDCDGAPDNGLACVRGATESCVVDCGVNGTRTCTSTCAWGVCTPLPGTCCPGSFPSCTGSESKADIGWAASPSELAGWGPFGYYCVSTNNDRVGESLSSDGYYTTVQSCGNDLGPFSGNCAALAGLTAGASITWYFGTWYLWPGDETYQAGYYRNDTYGGAGGTFTAVTCP